MAGPEAMAAMVGAVAKAAPGVVAEAVLIHLLLAAILTKPRTGSLAAPAARAFKATVETTAQVARTAHSRFKTATRFHAIRSWGTRILLSQTRYTISIGDKRSSRTVRR